MKKLFSNLILVSTLIFSSNVYSETITVPMVIVSIEVDQTMSEGSQLWFVSDWDPPVVSEDKEPDYMGLISIPWSTNCKYMLDIYSKKNNPGFDMDKSYRMENDMVNEGFELAVDIYKRYNHVCDNVNIESADFSHYGPWNKGVVFAESLRGSYRITRSYVDVKLNYGDKLYFEFVDVDSAIWGTGPDSETWDNIGKGELIFNGDQVLEGRIGSMDVKVEFLFN